MELKDNSVELTEEGIALAEMALKQMTFGMKMTHGLGEYTYKLDAFS